MGNATTTVAKATDKGDAQMRKAHRILYLVTHAATVGGPNPKLIDHAMGSQSVRKLLPDQPTAIICGTGMRHRETAEALRLEPTRYTSLAGEAAMLGSHGGATCVLMADGTIVEPSIYTSRDDAGPELTVLIHAEPEFGGAKNDTVIITDPAFVEDDLPNRGKVAPGSILRLRFYGSRDYDIDLLAEHGKPIVSE